MYSIQNWIRELKRPVQIGLVAGFLVALYTLKLVNHYKSEVVILPVESRSSGGNLGNLAAAAAAFGVSVPGGEGSDTNFVEILQSRTLGEKLLRTEFSYSTKTWYLGTERSYKKTLYEYLHAKNMDQAVKKLGEVVAINRDAKTRVLSILVDTTSPELSQAIGWQITKYLEEYFLKRNQTRGGYRAAFSQARLQDARNQYSDAESTLRSFLEGNRNYTVSADPRVRLLGMRLEMELRLRQQLISTLAMSYEQALMDEKNDIPILNVLEPGNLPIDKDHPSRASMIFLATVFVTALAWVRVKRKWLLESLMGAARQGAHDEKNA